MKKYIIALLAIAIIVGGYWLFQNQSIGSVQRASEYHATSTAAMTVNTHRLLQTSYNTSPATLGSIIIASSSATTFTIYNATSTSDISSSTFVVFEASAVEGTYTFDALMFRGVVLDLPPGFNGNAVITYR